MAIKIVSVQSPKWRNEEKTSIDVVLTTSDGRLLPHTAMAGTTTFDGADLFEQAIEGKFGKIASYVAKVVDLDVISASAQEQRILRVHIAYKGPEKRTSLYGYLGQLNAYAARRELTDNENRDRETLVAVAEWEQAMIDAIGGIVARGDINYLRSNDAWPQMSDGLSVSLAALADAS